MFSKNVESYSEQDLWELILIAESAKCFSDMRKFLKRYIECKLEAKIFLIGRERKLLYKAYTKNMEIKRLKLQVLRKNDLSEIPEYLKVYRKMLETELEGICIEAHEMLESLLKNYGNSDCEIEEKIFYMTMLGDSCWYLAEMKREPNWQEKAEKTYKNAVTLAEKLPADNPVRLLLHLNYSKCCWELLNKREKAHQMALQAYNSSCDKVNNFDENSSKKSGNSSRVARLLKEKLVEWEKKTRKDNTAKRNKGLLFGMNTNANRSYYGLSSNADESHTSKES